MFQDRIIYEEVYRGYTIFIKKMKNNNDIWFNGYIVIPKNNRYYDMCYEGINFEIEVHGGFTYSNYNNGIFDNLEQGKYVIGFDTLHYYDDHNTKNKEFVLSELKEAVDQIIERNK